MSIQYTLNNLKKNQAPDIGTLGSTIPFLSVSKARLLNLKEYVIDHSVKFIIETLRQSSVHIGFLAMKTNEKNYYCQPVVCWTKQKFFDKYYLNPKLL